LMTEMDVRKTTTAVREKNLYARVLNAGIDITKLLASLCASRRQFWG